MLLKIKDRHYAYIFCQTVKTNYVNLIWQLSDPKDEQLQSGG